MTHRNSICDELKYVQVHFDANYICNNEKYILKKGEILMLIEKKNDQWWLCTKDDGYNDYKPFFVPASYLIELNEQSQLQEQLEKNKLNDETDNTNVYEDDDEIYSNNTNNMNDIDDCDSPDYVNAILSELDERLSREYNDDNDNDLCENEIGYINNQQQFIIQQEQEEQEDDLIKKEPPPVKPRVKNINYVKEHEEIERKRLEEFYKAQTPEPDYDDPQHEYANVENIITIMNNLPVNIEPPDIENIDKQIINNNSNNDKNQQINDDPYDISEEYDKNKSIIEPNIPNGWLSSIDRHKRKYFYNQIDKNIWYLAYNKDGKPYFYSDNESKWELPELDLNANSSNGKRQFDQTKIDPDLKTLMNIRRNSLIKPSSPNEIKSNNQLELMNANQQQKTNQIKYSYKPTELLQHHFKILKVKEKGKKLKKKSLENHLIHLASSKLLFVRESSNKAHNKLEYYLDFKGGKCRKLEHKEFHKITDGVKNRIAFNVETLDGNEVVFIGDDENIVDKWRGEFSAIYENPETLHTVHPASTNNNFNPTTVKTPNNNNNNNQIKKEVLLIDDNNNNSNNTDYNDYSNNEISNQKSLKNTNLTENDVENLSSESNNNYDNTESTKTKIPNLYHTRHSADNMISNNIYPLLETSTNIVDMNVKPEVSTPTSKTSNYVPNIFRKKSTEPLDRKRSQSQSAQQQPKHKNIAEQLIAFFKKRPTAEQLKQRGILQETIFGTNLISLCNKEKRYVPEFVEDIIKAIEKKGLDTDGLYRVGGNLSDVQKLRIQVNQGKHNFVDCDIHVLTSTLKTFFRELEDPLVPTIMQERFIKAISLKDRHKKLQLIKELVCEIPTAHRETLKALFKHLLNVIKYSSLNRMHITNMSLVFGPTLLRLNPFDPINNCLNENINLQNELVEYILAYYEILFDQKCPNSSTSIAAGSSSTTTIISNTELTTLH